jgi:hypothetical protein
MSTYLVAPDSRLTTAKAQLLYTVKKDDNTEFDNVNAVSLHKVVFTIVNVSRFETNKSK